MNKPFPPSALKGHDDPRAVRLPEDHPLVKTGKIGVLLLNLGTPDGTDYWSMRRYLKEFGPKGRDYASIWNNERDEGPLKTITREQAERLAGRMAADDRVIVDWGMRYANPTTESRIIALREQGCDRILLVPLYPHYAAATTATAADHAFRTLMKMRWQPYVRVAPSWHDDPAYIEALAASIRNHLATVDFEPEVLVATFHGMPEKYLLKGDPYHCQCIKTGRLLREALAWPKDRFMTTFQSRFGTDKWLQPYTDKTVEALAKRGVKSMAMIAPGFTADCLETLEELDVENREIFEHNGGEKFTYVPCLNASEEGMQVIETVVRRELMGWI
jgi:protoporphyrin/coproporphyrin ferrochelatase